MKTERVHKFSSAQSLKQFNFSIIIFVGAIILLVVFKNFQVSNQQTYGDLHLRDKEEIAQAFVQLELRLSEVEFADLNSLIAKGMRVLPEYERDKLEKLQKKYAYKGHKSFTEDDVLAMRQLNYKAIGLLSEEDQSRFHYLMLKATGKVSDN
ncbi:MAG: hypothetical protein K9L86_03325 [Candidatus Omnitrophica bacterium]|nr:hypothetical protein [Candidatus Omnitrophota bacterium]